MYINKVHFQNKFYLMGGKHAQPHEKEKFLRDLLFLTKFKKYKLKDIGPRIDVHPTNLSHFLSGEKSPGKETINKFNMAFGEETKDQYQNFDDPSKAQENPEENDLSKVQEAALRYLQRSHQDEFNSLKDDKQFLKEEMRVINRTHEKNADAFQKMADAVLVIATTNSKLVDERRGGPAPIK